MNNQSNKVAERTVSAIRPAVLKTCEAISIPIVDENEPGNKRAALRAAYMLILSWQRPKTKGGGRWMRPSSNSELIF